jgi:hypothetical protein
MFIGTQKPGGSARTPSQISTPQTRNLSTLSSSPIDSPPAKRQKTAEDTASSPLHRNTTIRNLAKQRDKFECVLTGDGCNQAAHIYPHCMLKNEEEGLFGLRHSFWDHLKLFWPEEKVAAWTAQLFPQGITKKGEERVFNLITLSFTAHGYWHRGAFALKPISMSQDKTTLKIQFFWQKKQDTQPTMSLLTTPFSTEGLDHNEGAFEHGTIELFRQRKAIKSGDIFELKTDDATARPLPSFQLLEMQWFLTRVVGMAGAAFPYGLEDSDYEDSDGEISNLGLGDVNEDSFADPVLPNTPEFVRKVNLLLTKDSEHHREEVEGDRGRVGGRENE